jgi:hypothetical protein
MRTPAQIAASRANGAKSRGPVTPEGKAASSRNAVTHGITAAIPQLPDEPGGNVLLLEGEDPELFRETYDSFLRDFAPTSDFELELVHQMLSATWRLHRVWQSETELLNHTVDVLRAGPATPHPFMVYAQPQGNESTEHLPHTRQVALAFKSLSDDSKVLTTLQRYEAMLTRSFHRAYKTLEQHRANRIPEPENVQLQNEPKPAPSPAAEPKSANLQNEPKPATTAVAAPEGSESEADTSIPQFHPARPANLQNEPENAGGNAPTHVRSNDAEVGLIAFQCERDEEPGRLPGAEPVDEGEASHHGGCGHESQELRHLPHVAG